MSKNNKIFKEDEEEIERKYILVSKELNKYLGKGITNSKQIEDMGKKLFDKKFTGVFASDEVPDKFKYMVINVDKSFEPGSHWVAVAKDNIDEDDIYVFDSFGRTTKKLIPSLYGNGWVIHDSDYDENQKVNEYNCGQNSLSWLYIFDKLGKDKAMLI